MAEAILKYAQLKAWVEQLLAARNWSRHPQDDNQTIDEDLFWFGSIECAEEAAQMNRREHANLFLSGIPAMSESTIEAWLEGFYVDLDSYTGEEQQKYIEASNKLLEAKILHYFSLIDDEAHDEAFETWRVELDLISG